MTGEKMKKTSKGLTVARILRDFRLGKAYFRPDEMLSKPMTDSNKKFLKLEVAVGNMITFNSQKKVCGAVFLTLTDHDDHVVFDHTTLFEHMGKNKRFIGSFGFPGKKTGKRKGWISD